MSSTIEDPRFESKFLHFLNFIRHSTNVRLIPGTEPGADDRTTSDMHYPRCRGRVCTPDASQDIGNLSVQWGHIAEGDTSVKDGSD